eukprot:NODE_4244_length_693_cov_508.644201.p1 GENE.NODE_4244_length_693_cov_508.644201~~NODE_4244_length_693_cov_508.644201.p1  ORF type:complete len:163 (-),score=51.21 NODE_4244_length_693_cov_508.644201:114-602(-)
MPHCFGRRARTRDKFSKAYRTKGRPGISRYLTVFKRGEYVDIKADPSVQKGMPFSFYHGRTGVIFNVTKGAVGVEVTKVVGNRQLRKRMHLRIEHVRKSRCNVEFLRRRMVNDAFLKNAGKGGERVDWLKRKPELPKPGKIVKLGECEVKVLKAREFIENYF